MGKKKKKQPSKQEEPKKSKHRLLTGLLLTILGTLVANWIWGYINPFETPKIEIEIERAGDIKAYCNADRYSDEKIAFTVANTGEPSTFLS